MQEYAKELTRVVDAAYAVLADLPDAENARRPSAGKWSPREIVGHLIDSASVNHQRFVRANVQEDLVFPGYDQDAWVRIQRYQDAPWGGLLLLWRSYNFQIARLMASVPEDVRLKPTVEHNFDEIGWRPVKPGEPSTLDYLMADYVGHLKHHLGQLPLHR